MLNFIFNDKLTYFSLIIGYNVKLNVIFVFVFLCFINYFVFLFCVILNMYPKNFNFGNMKKYILKSIN